MKRDRFAKLLSGLCLVAVCMLPLAVAAQEAETSGARATLTDVNGDVVGDVIVSAMPDGLTLVQVSGQNLPPGFHGFHVHTTGICDASTDPAFDSAGGHLNPDGTVHPQHRGDLPVLYVTASGMATMAVITDMFTVEQLMDEDGSAIMVHENPDNYANIPERYGGPDEETLTGGDSGARIACGVFEANTPMSVDANMSVDGESDEDAEG